jgi:hypothetical protein
LIFVENLSYSIFYAVRWVYKVLEVFWWFLENLGIGSGRLLDVTGTIFERSSIILERLRCDNRENSWEGAFFVGERFLWVSYEFAVEVQHCTNSPSQSSTSCSSRPAADQQQTSSRPAAVHPPTSAAVG